MSQDFIEGSGELGVIDQIFMGIQEREAAGIATEPAKTKLMNLVREKDGVYVKKTKQAFEAISNFVLRPINRIVDADTSSMELKIILDSGEVFERTFPMDTLLSLTKFNKVLAHVDPKILFRGTSKDLGEIRNLIGQKAYTTSFVIDCDGLHKADNGKIVFVARNQVVTKSGQSCSDYVVNTDKIDIQTTLNPRNIITENELKELLYPLFHFNALPVAVTIISYIAVCFLQEVFRASGIKVGCLILTGEGGSGKSTTLEKVIQPIFGIPQAISASYLSEASLRDQIAACNTIPLIIEEFKASKLTKKQYDTICNMLRSSYDGHMAIKNKGGNGQSIEFRRPLIVVGESAPDESAIRERAMKVMFSKAALQANPEYKASLQYLEQNNAKLSKLGNSLLELAMIAMEQQSLIARTHNDFLARQKASNVSVNSWPDRVQKNFASAGVGLSLFLLCCKQLGVEYENIIQHSVPEMIAALQASFQEYLLEGRDQNLSVIDTALQIMFLRMELKEGKDFKHLRRKAGSSENPEVALNLDRAYASFLKYAHKQKVEVLDQTQFVAQLKTKEYFVDHRPVRMNNDNQRMYILDVRKLEAAIDGKLPAQKDSVSKNTN